MSTIRHPTEAFTSEVAQKFRLYSGLFFGLPYDYIDTAGTLLPLFTQFCRDELARGQRPDQIVHNFFVQRLGIGDFATIRERLLAFVRLCERQIVLFDAVEDAGFHHTRDLDGPGTLHEVAGRVQSDGLQEKLRELLDSFGVRIVLTAHPTQFYTEAVLGIIAELREAIRTDNVGEVNRLLLQLGRTRFLKKERPSPLDEAHAILWFMEHVLYRVIPDVHGRILDMAGLEGDAALDRQAAVELGFWPGGDRDGNPNVNPATTRSVADLLASSLKALYRADLAALRRRLTFDGVAEGLAAIAAHLDDGQSAYDTSDGLLADLHAVRRILIDRHGSLFLDELDAFIRRVRCFGFHFASLDLRQDSRIVASTVEAVLCLADPAASGYAGLDQAGRLERLRCANEARLQGKIASVLGGLNDPVLIDCLEVFRVAGEVQERYGKAAIHRFIVSNTNGPADILGLRLLAICAGFPADALPFDLVPLFETVDDLADAGETMATLFQDPVYRRHLESRGQVQHIMLGFSDGTKDGGYVSANWGIYRAKQDLSRLATLHGCRLVFFDGRGGPPARGGGNTHKFYRSLGKDIEGRTIHLTIQGQTISSTYGHLNSARYNLEQLASAGIDNQLYPANEDWQLSDAEAALIDELSTLAHGHYMALREHESFLPYLEHMSPLTYYASANNSSRPAKRPGGGRLTLEGLRAIPFVGAWSQLKQNIPGYYGLGFALEQIAKRGGLEDLKDLCRNSLYVRTLLENSMQSLSKVYLPLTAWIAQDPRFAAFHALIVTEARRTERMLLEVTGQESLLADDPYNQASIRMREHLITPMAVIQQYALIHLRRLGDGSPGDVDAADPGADDRSTLEKMVVKTMATCVNASRNSV